MEAPSNPGSSICSSAVSYFLQISLGRRQRLLSVDHLVTGLLPAVVVLLVLLLPPLLAHFLVQPPVAAVEALLSRVLEGLGGRAAYAEETVDVLRLALRDPEAGAVVPLLAAVAAEHEAIVGPAADAVHRGTLAQEEGLVGHVDAEGLHL